MPLNSSYASYVMELLEPFGEITGRAMFGGFGVWERGVMFALLDSESTLYFKVSAETEARYRQAGAKQFAPGMKGKDPTPMPYWSVPAEVLDDSEALEEWARAAIKTAHATAKPKAQKPAKKAAAGSSTGDAKKPAAGAAKKPTKVASKPAAKAATKKAASKPTAKPAVKKPAKKTATKKPATKPGPKNAKKPAAKAPAKKPAVKTSAKKPAAKSKKS
jgi:DNA transformation protein and related proteins